MFFLYLKDVIILANRANPYETQQYVASLFAKVSDLGLLISKGLWEIGVVKK